MPIKATRREALLIAIAKARQWNDDLANGRAASFAVIAQREGKVERHVRLLAPLAFVSPRVVSALLEGTGPADLILTKLARAPNPLRGLVLRHRNHGAGERAVGLSQLIQNREVIGVGDWYQVAWNMPLRPVGMVIAAARDHGRQLAGCRRRYLAAC